MSIPKDFHKLMLDYNTRFRKDYDDVPTWLKDLNSRLSLRAMARIIRADRGVIARKLKEFKNNKSKKEEANE